MSIRWVTGFLDSPDSSAERFWAAVTGCRLSSRRGPGGEFATLLPPTGDAYLRVQVVGAPPPRCHLDLHVDDVPAQAVRAVALGASVLLDEDDLVVLRSPAGLAFCLVPHHGEAIRPDPYGAGLVDQMCRDLPAGQYAAEAGFWAALTGWPRRALTPPEFEVLTPPPGLPLRLLLQRTQAGPAGMHLDLASSDRAAEVVRHVALGASVQHDLGGGWTTLRDPAGRAYCVTDRAFGGR